ncbi:MAG: hypothetical protein H6581_11705 [Bacteroidia bacterium]|nr:hypothetical protein [Bacteroidia bacterium]
MKIHKFLFMTGVLSLWFSGCSFDKTPMQPIEESPCDPNHVYFQNDVLPILLSNCAKSGCHSAASHAEGYNYSTWSGTMKSVVPGNLNKSTLYWAITTTGGGRMPPWGLSALTQTQISTIGTWIMQGAINDHCTQDTTSCLTLNMSFSQDIKPILSTNCYGCHSGSSASGGIDLSKYAGVSDVAVTGKLYNSVAQNGLAAAMPPDYKLTACEISQIKSWVDDGFLNN